MKGFKHSFRTKLLLSFLICALVPLLFCSLLLVQIIGIRLNRKEQQDFALELSSIQQAMDSVSTGLTDCAQSLMDDPSVIRAVCGLPVPDTVINKSLFLASEKVRSFALAGIYDLSGSLLYSTGSAMPHTLPCSWGVLRATRDSASPVFQVSSDSDRPGILQGAVILQDKGHAPVGYLVLEMAHDNFYSLFDGRYDRTDGVLLVNSFWRPVYASDSDLWNHVAPMLRMAQINGEPMDRHNMTYSVVRHDPTGLFLILQKPQAFNQETTHMMYLVSLSCTLICVIIAILFFIPMSQQIFAPIKLMHTGFQKLEKDDLEVQLPTDRQDELGELAIAFNHTVRALKQNRQELLCNQQELNDAQIRLLQTQLNPHFLCNTLDTMKWISKIHHVPEVAEMSANLADILRYCITSEEFVPLYKEIDFLQRYIDIQKMRMGDRFKYSADMPEELSGCIVPKMILQPIVENAVLHGLSETEDSNIRIAIRSVGKDLQITVSDNGCGLPDEMIGKPYMQQPDTHGHHLGLYNVNTILTKHYGSRYGLFLDRGPDGIGTTVIATLPANFGGITDD